MNGIDGFPRPDRAASATLSSLDQESIRQLRETDRKVRAHEQAHLSAAGDSAQGGMKLETKVGPDGKPYAVSGEVSIQVQGGRTPEESLRKAQIAQKAALAPADPSPQDLKVAQRAAQTAHQARREMESGSRAGKSGTWEYTSSPALGGHVDLVA